MTSVDSDEWRSQMENDIAGINQILQTLSLQLAGLAPVNVLPSVSNPSNPASLRSPFSPPPETLCKEPSNGKGTCLIKPASPSDFLGDCTTGQAFLNSCELYLQLAPHQFGDDQAKIMWVMSFMKGGRAARFVDRQMKGYQSIGSLSYTSWTDFMVEFVADFCLKNEVQTSQTELETSKYFQGPRTVNEYVDDFRKLIDRARYFEGAHIVLKFRQGLNPKVQDHVACLTTGCPSDEAPKQWYDAAILCDKNHIANEAFCTSSRIVPRNETTSASNSMF